MIKSFTVGDDLAIVRKTLCLIAVLILFLMNFLSLNLSADYSVNNFEPSSIGSYPIGIRNDTWPMFRGNITRTGNTSATGPDYYYELWSHSANIWWSSPAVMYDQIYITTSSNTQCLDLAGNVLWTYNAGSRYSSPLVHNGRVYISTGSGPLICLDANATGSGTTTNYWTYRPSGVSFAAGSPVTDGSKIYYPTQHASGLHAVWITNGSKAWNASLGGSTTTESSPAFWDGKVYCGGGYSYVGGINDVFCFNATNGDQLWKFTTGGDVCGTLAVEYGRVYFGSLDGKVYCVDANGSSGSTTKYWEYDVNADIYGSAAVGYNKVYIGDAGNRLHCFDALAKGGTTTRYWVQTIAPTTIYGVCSSPAITADRIYIGNAANAIHCRNRNNGAELWSKVIGAATYGVSSSPAVYKDMLFVTSDDGNLYALAHDKLAPKIIDSNPDDDDIDVDMYQNISIQFDEDIDVTTLTDVNVYLKNSTQAMVPGSISNDMNIDTIYFNPDQPLQKDETYTMTVTGNVKDLHENGLDGNGNGIAEGPGVDDFSIAFTTIPFYPPTISKIAIPTLTEDVPYSVNISSTINDDDTSKSQLILTEDSEYANLRGYVLEFLYPEGITSDLVNLTVSDGLFTVWKLIPIKINPVNDLPVIENIPELIAYEDQTYTLDIKKYVSDVDTSISELNLYVFSYYYSNSMGYIDKDGLFINLTYPNGVLSDLINVTVYEGNLEDEQSDAITFKVKVIPVNDKPVLDEPLKAITIQEDETDTGITLLDWFTDIDDDKLDYSYENMGDGHVDVIINSAGGVTLEPEPDWSGEESINFTAADSESETVSSILKVVVEPVNDPPKIEKINSPTDGDTFEYDDLIDLKAIVSDVDLNYGDELTYYWSSSEDGGIGYDCNVTGVQLTPGTHTITLLVEDSEGEDVTATVTIKVKAEEKPDTDDDGITDDIDTDDDNDGLPDVWELKYPDILDPLDASDAALDHDEDGYTNLEEYLGADGKPTGQDSSDPTDKASIPKSKGDTTDDGDESSGLDLTMIVVIIVIIVIVVLVLIFVMVKNRKKSEVEEPTTDQVHGDITFTQPQMEGQTQMPMQQMPMYQYQQEPMQMPVQMPMPMPMPMSNETGQPMMGYGVGVAPYQDTVPTQQPMDMSMDMNENVIMNMNKYGQYDSGQYLDQRMMPMQPQFDGTPTQEYPQLPPTQSEMSDESGEPEGVDNIPNQAQTVDPAAQDDILGNAPVYTPPEPTEPSETQEIQDGSDEEE